MISRLIKKLRLALCALGLATPGEKPTHTIFNANENNGSAASKITLTRYEDFQLGILVRSNSSKVSGTGPIPGFNMTREFRKHLIKELKQARDIKEHISRTKEQYALCKRKFGRKLSKTSEFLDIYYKHMNDTYNAIYNILHGQPDQITRSDLAAALRGVNETLKKQAWEEMKHFPIYPDRRLGD